MFELGACLSIPLILALYWKAGRGKGSLIKIYLTILKWYCISTGVMVGGLLLLFIFLNIWRVSNG